MTPKETAGDLFNKMFTSSRSIEVEQAKKCALIAVNEISIHNGIKNLSYWQEVKKEIELL
jgi:hypothetical protein